MRFGQSTLRATLTVCGTLLVTFVVTGFASSAFHREREKLGIAHYDAGKSLEQKGELDPALDEYRKALLFAPNNTDYRLSLAKALLEAGRLNEAQSHLEALVQEDPTSGPINLLVGRLAFRQHDLRRAIEYYQRGVYEYWPESELAERRQARWELANLLHESGDRNGFIGELMQLYTNLPSSAIAEKLKVGSLLLSNGAISEASRIFQEQARVAPQNADARAGLAQVHFAMGEYVSARHEFQRVLRLDPKNAEAAQMLALTNEVIDLDPALPSITASEQLRRSRNLLERVLKELSSCTNASPAFAQRVSDAGKLVSAPKHSEDDAVSMQSAAMQLWSGRDGPCGKTAPQDKAIDTVLTRIGHE
ncbi:MAG TPA: tetratricopeptide repeat protein [Bryobacteraceae bacterium]|nr:tetratricopeptide repeat protein [Bryobacteraceae bacterium]